MQIESPAFARRSAIPVRYTRDGQNASPPVKWSQLPEGTRELALIFECVTPSTREPYVQWLVAKIPPAVEGLPEGYQHEAEPETPVPVVQGRNANDNVGYDGPLGTTAQDYQYRFMLYALDQPIDVPPGFTEKQLRAALDGHVLETAELPAHYKRPRG